MKKQKIFALLLSVAMLATLAACGTKTDPSPSTPPATSSDAPDSSAPPDSAAPKSGYIDILNVGSNEGYGYLLWGSSISSNGPCFYLIYDPIFYFDTETNQVASDILESFDFKDDGNTLVMELRDDIVFSNGEKATGEDLLYSFTSNAEEARGSVFMTTNYANLDFENSYAEGNTVYLKSDGTVSMVMKIGGFVVMPLMCKSWCEQVGWEAEEWYSGPVGSGPYEVTNYVTDNYYLFTLREDYWDIDEASFPAKQIRFTYYPEASTMYMDLENGAIDIALAMDSGDYTRALSDDKIGVELVPGEISSWLVFDIEESPFSDINLRKAVAHGVKWDEVATAGKGVLWDEADSSIPDDLPAYISVGQYKYDPELAKEYLAKAGYAPGELKLYMITPSNGTSSKSCTVLQEYLRVIGIELEFDALEMSQIIQARPQGTGDLDFYAMNQDNSARSALSIFNDLRSTARPKNCQTITDKTVDELLDKASKAKTTEEANGYFKELQQWIYDTYRLVSYLDNVDSIAFNKSVIVSANTLNRKFSNLRNIEFVQQP
jgi:peptide/nickel transport system substrate-binding protein